MFCFYECMWKIWKTEDEKEKVFLIFDVCLFFLTRSMEKGMGTGVFVHTWHFGFGALFLSSIRIDTHSIHYSNWRFSSRAGYYSMEDWITIGWHLELTMDLKGGIWPLFVLVLVLIFLWLAGLYILSSSLALAAP